MNTKQNIFSIFKLFTVVSWILLNSGCYPLYLPETDRADAQHAYETKYFVVKPPKGRWTAEAPTLTLRVPHEGNLLAGVVPGRISFYRVLRVVGLFEDEKFRVLSIDTDLLDAKEYNNDPELMAKAAKTRFERSRSKWWEYRQKWTGTLIKVPTRPVFEPVKIGNKTFYEAFEVYADTGEKIRGDFPAYYYYFTKQKSYIFEFRPGRVDDVQLSQLERVMESFEPIAVNESRETMLMEEAIFMWPSGAKQGILIDRAAISDVRFNKLMTALQNAVHENRDDYVAHVLLGIMYLTPKNSFYDTIVAPTVKKNDDVQRVLTDNMRKYDHYSLNPIWIVNKRDFYSYLLHGDYDDKAAREEFNKALEIKPDSYIARYCLSWLYLRIGEYEQAVSEYKKILEHDPTGC